MSECVLCGATEDAQDRALAACARCGAAICEACAETVGEGEILCPACAEIELAVALHADLLDAVERTEKLLSRIILTLKGHALYTRSRAEEIGQLHQDLTDLIARAHRLDDAP
jgi:hypothetical protein